LKQIGWGIIGSAGIADKRTIPEGIIPSEGSRLVALMGPHEEKLKPMAEKYGIDRCYTSEEELLSDPDVDAVYVASPNYLHHRQSIAAAEAGKHVLCEKPFAMDVRECEEIIAACKKNDVKLSVGFMMRFHSCHQEAQRIAEEDRLGQLVTSRVQFGFWYPDIQGAWRQIKAQGGGGSLMDLGIHGIDLVRMFMGDVTEVSAFNDTLIHNYDVEDSSLIIMKFESGAYGVVDSFFNIARPAGGNALEVNGTKGSVLSQGSIGQSSTGTLKVSLAGVDARKFSPEPVNIYRAEVEDLVRAINEDSEPLNSGEEATKDQAVAMAAFESSRTGRTIRL
jgi:predicted dehydrogenase